MTAFKSLVFLILVPGMVAGHLPLAVFLKGTRFETGALSCLAFPFWVIGGVILLRSFWNFIVEGRGTPAPMDPPRQLVVTGFYRRVRNPMYWGVVLILIGYFLWFGYWLLPPYALLVFIAAHLFVTLYEEPSLKKRFGAAYEDYFKRVPRWIPRFK